MVGDTSAGTSRRRRRLLAGSLIIAGVGLWSGVWLLTVSREQALFPDPPVPNAYEALVDAGHAIRGNPPEPSSGTRRQDGKLPATQRPDATDPLIQALRAYLDSNRDPLAKAHALVDQPGRVPVRFESTYLAASSSRLGDLRALSRLLVAEGQVAAAEGRLADAIRCDLDVLRLGKQAGRGGLLNDSLVGLAIQRNGVEAINRINTQLTADDLRELLQSWDVLDREDEPYEMVAARELVFARRANGWKGQAALVFPQVRKLLQSAIGAGAAAAQREKTRKLQLRIELAIRLFQLDRGAYPATLDELVPRYLTASQRADQTASKIRYRRDAEGYHLDTLDGNATDRHANAATARTGPARGTSP